MGQKIKIITFEEARAEEEMWRTVYDTLVMAEHIIVNQMAEFDELNMNTLLDIKEIVSIARQKALGQWDAINTLIKPTKCH